MNPGPTLSGTLYTQTKPPKPAPWTYNNSTTPLALHLLLNSHHPWPLNYYPSSYSELWNCNHIQQNEEEESLRGKTEGYNTDIGLFACRTDATPLISENTYFREQTNRENEKEIKAAKCNRLQGIWNSSKSQGSGCLVKIKVEMVVFEGIRGIWTCTKRERRGDIFAIMLNVVLVFRISSNAHKGRWPWRFLFAYCIDIHLDSKEFKVLYVVLILPILSSPQPCKVGWLALK